MVALRHAVLASAVLLAGSAAAAELAAASGERCAGGDGGCRAAKGGAAGTLPGLVLLQHAGQRSKTLAPSQRELTRRPLQPLVLLTETAAKDAVVDPSAGLLPLCHISIIRRFCGVGLTLSKARLAALLSATTYGVAELWAALGMSATAEEASCEHLCSTMVEYFWRAGAVLPPSSDLGCYDLGDGGRCDVVLQPGQLVRDLAEATNFDPPDGGPNLVTKKTAGRGSLVNSGEMSYSEQHRSPTDGGTSLIENSMSATYAPMDLDTATGASPSPALQSSGLGSQTVTRLPSVYYSISSAMLRLAAHFRFFPSLGLPALNVGAMEEGAEAVAKEELAVADLRVRAWLALVLTEIFTMEDAPSRSQWFGGDGALSKEDVDGRVLRSLNIVERMAFDGVHYVFPADEAPGSTCSMGGTGFVWRWLSDEEDYAETTGPNCSASEEPLLSHCAVDGDGRKFVYLCRRWLEALDPNRRVAVLVLELLRHAGHGGATYDFDAMSQLSQATQLANAPTFLQFAQDVAKEAWLCNDTVRVSVPGVPLQCVAGPCACEHFASFCEDATHGSEIQKQCPATCGTCGGPREVSEDFLSPSRRATEPDCADNPQYKDPLWNATCVEWEGYGCSGYKFSDELMQNCRRTCRVCSWVPSLPTPAPTPAPTRAPTITKPTALSPATTRAPTTTTPTAPSPATTAEASAGGQIRSDCVETNSTKQFFLDGFTYKGPCDAFALRGWCSQAKVRTDCPITCGVCLPAGCEDDPTYSVNTGAGFGNFTCERWKSFTCPDEAIEHCPASCRRADCAR